MKHMSEEELIAFRDGEPKGRDPFAAHLQECAECRGEMERIEAVFAALDAMPVPDPGEDYGRRVWQQIAPRLPEKRARWWHAWFAPGRLVAVGAMVALVILAFWLGRITKPPKQGGSDFADAGKVRERVLMVAVGEHLGRSEMVLVELANTQPRQGQRLVNISAEQKRAEDLVEENRLYRETALQEGDAAMASTLDELERVLLDVANSPDEVTPAQFEAIQKRIEAQGILFKVRVVRQGLDERKGKTKAAPAENQATKERNKV
jgi:hypothetical protein